MEKLAFGTSGFPSAAPKKDPIAALKILKELGLDCLELEFAHGVRIRDETAKALKETAQDLDIVLTAHAPYYINLNAKEQDKIDASMNRLLQTARLAGMCNAFSMTFHAAFYMKDEPRSVFDIVKRYLAQIMERLRDEGSTIHLRPELTGRRSQFGTLGELCVLSQEIPNVYPCLDFAGNGHRPDGKGNRYKDFAKIFEKYRDALGKEALSQMHLKVAGILYGPKGEIHHLTLKQSAFNYEDFLKACIDFDLKGCIICESPDQEKDALLLRQTYLDLQPKKGSWKHLYENPDAPSMPSPQLPQQQIQDPLPANEIAALAQVKGQKILIEKTKKQASTTTDEKKPSAAKKKTPSHLTTASSRPRAS